MVWDLKFTVFEVNNSERIRTSFKVPCNTFSKNGQLDLDRVLSNFPEIEDFHRHIDIIHKFALVREWKVDWENLLAGIGTEKRVLIKIKKVISDNDFMQYILLPELATKFCMDMIWFTWKRWCYLQISFIKALWKWSSETASQWRNGSSFYTLLCLIGVRETFS